LGKNSKDYILKGRLKKKKKNNLIYLVEKKILKGKGNFGG
jgi:hypothetical protein